MKLFNKPFVKWSLAGFVIGMLALVFLGQQVLAQEPQPAIPDETLAAAIQSIAPQMSSAHFNVNWNVVGTGGGDVSSAHFQISSTLGQPTVGHKSSPHYQTCTGFWWEGFWWDNSDTWLSLIYLNGDNDLAQAIYPTIADLTTASASITNTTSLVLWDGEGMDDSALYEIANGTATPITAPWLGAEADMGSSQTLVDFVTWGRTNYPTDHAFLSILDHGGGWSPDIQVEGSAFEAFGPTAPLTVTFPSQAHYRSKGGTGMAWDYHTDHGDYSFLSTSELHDALDAITSSGTDPIEVLFYDACFMGMLEEAHALAPYADYFIASENQAWASQAYGEYLSAIESNTTPAELAASIVQTYEASLQAAGGGHHPYTLAALDLSQIGAVNAAFANLSQTLYEHTNDAAIREQIHAVYANAQKFDSDADGNIETSCESYVDLYHFAENLTTMVSDAEIVTRAQALLTAWDAGLVVAEVHGSGTAWMGDTYWNLENAHGLSVYLPFGEELVMVIDQPGGGTLEVPVRSLYGVKEAPHARWRDFINDFIIRGWGGGQAFKPLALPDRSVAYLDGPRDGLLPVQWRIMLPLLVR